MFVDGLVRAEAPHGARRVGPGVAKTEILAK
jgi:hypothetical protein